MATLEVLVYFSGSDSTVNRMRTFCRIKPLQMHHSHLRRPVPSRQSACHHPLMHAAPHNRRLQTLSEERDEAHLICSVPLELILRYGNLSVFSIRTSLDHARWRKCSASFALGMSFTSIKLDTYHSVVVHMPRQY